MVLDWQVCPTSRVTMAKSSLFFRKSRWRCNPKGLRHSDLQARNGASLVLGLTRYRFVSCVRFEGSNG